MCTVSIFDSYELVSIDTKEGKNVVHTIQVFTDSHPLRLRCSDNKMRDFYSYSTIWTRSSIWMTFPCHTISLFAVAVVSSPYLYTLAVAVNSSIYLYMYTCCRMTVKGSEDCRKWPHVVDSLQDLNVYAEFNGRTFPASRVGDSNKFQVTVKFCNGNPHHELKSQSQCL